jgi:transglutaminase-like putative cysteine protease
MERTGVNAARSHPLVWVVRRIGWQNLLVLSLLLTVLSGIAMGLGEAVNGIETGFVWSLASLGLLAGWLLARSRLKGVSAAALAFSGGVAAALWWVGRLSGSLARFLLASNELALQALRWRPGAPAVDLAPLEQAFLDVGEHVLVLIARAGGWLAALVSQPAFDPLATALVWGVLLWLVGWWAGWVTRRYWRPLAAILPGATILGISQAYSGQSAVLLILVLGASLFLMAVLTYGRNERQWKSNAIDYSEDIRVELALLTIPLVLGLTMLAAVSPAISIQRLSQAIQDFKRAHQPAPASNSAQHPSLADSLGLKSQPAQPQDAFAGLRAGGLPRQHLLGTGAELNEQVVMLIQTGEIPPGPPESITEEGVPRYYWRSLTYDRYTGRGWLTSSTQTTAYSAGQPAGEAWREAITQVPPGQKLVRQHVRILQDLGELLYAAGTPLEVDQDYQIAWRRLPSSGAQALTANDIFGAHVGAAEYQAASLYPLASPQVLRQTGSVYPDWLLKRYLALPEDLPARVGNLAIKLTASARTPYDRAVAIESYLRKTYPYTLDLPDPPTNTDLVDYFLFDLRTGYCDYYASAMVVLARAAGLPARLATGYASGSYDALNARYIITAAQAHSWPEIYFPGYGWVPFEPTAGQAPLTRSEQGGESTLPGLGNPVQVPEFDGRLNWGRILLWAAGFALSLMAALFLWNLWDTWRLGRLSPVEAMRKLFNSLSHHAGSMNVQREPGDTPWEFAQAMQKQVVAYLEDTRWHSNIQPAQGEMRQIVRLYTRSVYSSHPPIKSEQQRAIRIWKRLRWRLRLASWISKWPIHR